MAFLCPSRRGRQKKKHKEPKAPFLGRITGSSSVDTLVRVGLEKQHGLTPDARMCVTHDFFATTPGELSARKGDHVYRLYKEGDWIYVITELGQEGFMPDICLTDLSKKDNTIENFHRHKPHASASERRASVDGGKRSTHSHSPEDSVSATATYNVRNAEKERLGKRVINTSTRAHEGSDNSSNSQVSLRHQINPLPKPARQLSIPDVVSNAGDSVTQCGKQQSTTATDQFSPMNSYNSTHSSKQSPHSNNGDNLYHHDKMKHSNFLELPLRKPGQRDSHTSNLSDSITEVKTFTKKPGRKLAIVFAFDAPDENDLKVQRGEVVTVLNEKDPDWVWVETKNKNEGFLPKSFTCPIPDDLLKMDEHFQTKSKSGLSRHQPSQPAKLRNSNAHDVRELVMKGDFDAQSTDDISVKSGEQVFADLANQIEKDWLWVYAPKSQSYGYIPKSNVRWMATNDSSAVTKVNSVKSSNVTSVIGKPV